MEKLFAIGLIVKQGGSSGDDQLRLGVVGLDLGKGLEQSDRVFAGFDAADGEINRVAGEAVALFQSGFLAGGSG